MKTVGFIPQLHKSGCGIACVAMILGCDYQEALKIVHPNYRRYKKGKRPKFGTSLIQISKALKKNKIKFTVKFVDGHKLKKKNPTILGVRWPKDNGKKPDLPDHWHWVVCSKGKILDPFTFDGHKSYSLSYCQKKVFVIFEVKRK